jgi:hypothetical protein
MHKILNKLAVWTIFGVLVALVPLAFSYLVLIIRHKPATIEAIASDGGLFLITSAICAGAIGEVIASGGQAALLAKIVLSGATTVILLLSALLFASIIEGRLNDTFDPQAISVTSVWIFAIGILPCAGCIVLSEL